MTSPFEILCDGASALGLSLDQHQLEKFKTFATELGKWNTRMNLTAITRLDEIIIKHFLDSLTVPAFTRIHGKMLDIGSGGGFPGIPIKIFLPGQEIVSVDAVGKKIMFQRHMARLLGFEKFVSIHARGESLDKEYAGSFDIIVSRAFTDLRSFVKMALPLLSQGGYIIAMKGGAGVTEAEAAEKEIEKLGGRILSAQKFELPFTRDQRSIISVERA